MTGWIVAMVVTAGWPMRADLPPDVKDAHAAYLKADWPAFSNQMRAALGAHAQDKAVTKNLLELLDASFEARRGAPLPVDFKLPAEIEKMKVTIKRRENAHNGNVMFQPELYVEAKKGVVENLRIERFPNVLVMDQGSGLGEWEVSKGENGGDEIWAAGECGPTPPPDGLYVLTVKVKGQPEVKGWFAFHQHGSSASPYFLSPNIGGATSPTPTFKWDDFRSPENKKWESRFVSLLVFEPSWNIAWAHFMSDSAEREVTSAALKPGSYEAVLKFQERRKFGTLFVGRDSAIALPFKVE